MTDGVLVVDKPEGPTSHDVVGRARRIYQTREVGHAGTLDPMATGVLVLLFGEATKLSAYLTLDDKSYRATIVFGRATDSLDATGKTTEERELEPGFLGRERLLPALDAERARTQQVPPSVSAIQIDGVRAHQATRRGKPPELEPRAVAVRQLELIEQHERSIAVELTVSKGYYVRALARDLGERLGVPAHLSALRRLSSGVFLLREAVAWPPDEPVAPIPTADAARRALPSATLTADGERRARLGQRLGSEHFSKRPDSTEKSPEAWLSEDGRIVALGESREPDSFAVVRGFRQRS